MYGRVVDSLTFGGGRRIVDSMDDVAALELLETLTDRDARKAAGRSVSVNVVTLLKAAQSRLAEGEEPEDGEPAAIWALLSRLRAEADELERDLIRFLMYESEEGRKWQDVADMWTVCMPHGRRHKSAGHG